MSLVDQVQQPTGGRDQYVNSLAQGTNLSCLLDPAVHHGVSKVEHSPVRGKAFPDLHGQFTGGAEYECTGWTTATLGGPFVLSQAVEDRNRKCTGLSSTRLRTPQDIAPSHGGRDCLCLDWGRFVVPLGHDRIDYGLMQPHVLEGRH